jgi:phosphate acetyltransferase
MTTNLGRYQNLIERCRAMGPIRTAVVYPCSREALAGAVEAAQMGLITPVLVGPKNTLIELAGNENLDLADYPIVDAPDAVSAASQAAALARTGDARILMKGSLHTDELMGIVVSKEAGLRTSRRISHVFVMDVPSYERLLLITDCAVNISPDLKVKRDIVQNAIDVAHVLGVAYPKIAILSAVETVNPDIPSTIDAAALCKMADRGQITGAILDGPLAFDNAISRKAAQIKGIRSPVSGEVDVLVVPGLEAGNMLFKQLQYLANSEAAGVVVGAKVPLVLTSRADSARTRMASTAVSCLLAHGRAAQFQPKGPS